MERQANMSTQGAPNNEFWTLFWTAIGFVTTWVGGIITYIYQQGKLVGRIDANENSMNKRVSDIESNLDRITNSFLDADGDNKYLTVKRHVTVCALNQEKIQAEYKHIQDRFSLVQKQNEEIKSSIKAVQDSILLLATSKNSPEK